VGGKDSTKNMIEKGADKIRSGHDKSYSLKKEDKWGKKLGGGVGKTSGVNRTNNPKSKVAR